MTEKRDVLTPNNWLAEEGAGQREHFLSEREDFLVERELCYATMASFIESRFAADRALRLLDLGCGDGALGGYLAKGRPGTKLALMDGSVPMLEAAGKAHPGATLIRSTFEEWIDSPLGLPDYEVAVSSMAIHHLAFPEKERLFSRVFHELKTGGVFMNYDVVRPASPESEAFQFEMWRSWSRGRAAARGGDSATHDGLPESYKAKGENKPSGLEEQLAALRRAGFGDAECLIKRGIFALFIGTKF
jgi:tRNA (cmo5U34)-methyltransferase